jgi:hypothetical protein
MKKKKLSKEATSVFQNQDGAAATVQFKERIVAKCLALPKPVT